MNELIHLLSIKISKILSCSKKSSLSWLLGKKYPIKGYVLYTNTYIQVTKQIAINKTKTVFNINLMIVSTDCSGRIFL